MKQCNICSNNEVCRKNNWVTTMDKGYKIEEPINEMACDNFISNKAIKITKIERS